MESTIKIKQEPGLKARGNATITTAPSPLGTQHAAAISVKTERLTSFRVPRDLTLGGLTNGRTPKPAANKKVYTPNLNAVRNKDTNVKTASTGTKQRVKTERNKDSRAKSGKGSLIQTSGIFSEGLAQRTLQKSRSEKYNNSSSKEPGEAIRKPVFRTEIKIDPEEERKRIHDLFGELDEDTGEDSKKHGNEANMPVKLENLDYRFKPATLKTEIKDEAMVPKAEVRELLDSIKSNQVDHSNFFLLQLPDALPGRTDIDPKKGQDQQTTQDIGNQNGLEPPRCTVRELEEGYVGKVLRYRSGKVKLLLGNTLFDLTLGMDSGFLQELVSINTNTAERSGNIIDLATIKAKLNASPDWEHLFRK
ncbi:DNA-directed RNA polymerase III subunit RPC4 [Wyeomyia smithii]|uniref:DNA-directed RNA polymerase III subunit RPC4 n=1 Tax=Wyeomyia smithii TaxID=174621 RepID=UPI002467F6CB|nr:DNA-directed RNA polymerase III subunit RPC4 [Wyeomyia smithii]